MKKCTVWGFTLHVPSKELDINMEFELPDVVNRLVMEALCSDEQYNKDGKLPDSSSTSSKLQWNDGLEHGKTFLRILHLGKKEERNNVACLCHNL